MIVAGLGINGRLTRSDEAQDMTMCNDKLVSSL